MPQNIDSDLVGTKVALIVTEHDKGEGFKYTSYEFEDPTFEARMQKKFGDSVRLRLPGRMFTCEFNSGRVNVHIDKDGVITKICYG